MKIQYILSSVLLVLPLYITGNVEQDYKKDALCVEVFTEGIGWTHTFGEGRCPAGSNKDEYSQKLKKIDSIVEVGNSAQQAVVAIGEVLRQKRIIDSLNKNQIINKFRFSTINENNKNKMGEDFFKLLTKRNTKLSVGIGEVLVFITEGSIQDCYIPKFETNYPYKSGKWFILSNQPVCNIPGENLKYFYPFYSNEEQPSYNSIHPVTFDYKKKKDLYKICVKVSQKIACKDKAKLDIDFEDSQGFVYNIQSPKRMVIVSKIENDLIEVVESYYDEDLKDYIDAPRKININDEKIFTSFDQKIEFIEIQNNQLIYKIID